MSRKVKPLNIIRKRHLLTWNIIAYRKRYKKLPVSNPKKALIYRKLYSWKRLKVRLDNHLRIMVRLDKLVSSFFGIKTIRGVLENIPTKKGSTPSIPLYVRVFFAYGVGFVPSKYLADYVGLLGYARDKVGGFNSRFRKDEKVQDIWQKFLAYMKYRKL